MKNLRHLRIGCEGQHPSHRYRRGVVDYALISLRIAIERAPLKSLESLSLLSIHPAAVLYLQPNLGYGTSPVSRKRWSQIRYLTIHMESFPYKDGLPTDHFKLLHTYLQSFPEIRQLVFHWKGEKSLSPLSLETEVCLQSTFQPASIPHVPDQGGLSLRPLRFPFLERMELVNAIMDASQIASFISDHRHSLHEFNLQDIALRSGTWEEALAPVMKLSSTARDEDNQRDEEPIDVPIILSPAGVSRQQMRRVIHVLQRQKEGLRSLAKAWARERFWGRPDQMKRLLRSSVFSWR